MASFREPNTSRVGLGTLEHTEGALRAAITLCFWYIFLLSLGTLGSCSVHGLSASVGTSSPEGCCVSTLNIEREIETCSLDCILCLLPKMFGRARVASRAGSGRVWEWLQELWLLHSPFICWALETQRGCGKSSAVAWAQQSCNQPDGFSGQSLRQGDEKQPSALAQRLRGGCS